MGDGSISISGGGLEGDVKAQFLQAANQSTFDRLRITAIEVVCAQLLELGASVDHVIGDGED